MSCRELTTCKHLVIGSDLAAMICALCIDSDDVLLISSDTFLYAQMVRSGDYRIPEGLKDPWRTLLFPDCVFEQGRIHPDRLQRYGETLMRQHGVRLLYACQVLDAAEYKGTIAHKSGKYFIPFQAVHGPFHLPAPVSPCYCLHTMSGQEERIMLLPTAASGTDAKSQFTRYENAIRCLPKGMRLARGGTAVTCQMGPPYSTTEQPAPQLSLAASKQYDVIVVGGGTAGAPAAFYCARQGLNTLVLEMNHCLGGTGTVGGVSYYWFGRRDGATAQIDAAVDRYYQQLNIPRNPGLWNNHDQFLPDLKAHALLGLCLDSGVDVQFGALVYDVEKRSNTVTGVYYAQNGKTYLARAKIVLDCTGDGDVCVLSGADHTYGNEIDGMTYWASLAQYTAPDQYQNNFSTMVHVGDPLDYSRFIQASRFHGGTLWDHGQYVAVRESRHIHGMETITLESLVSGNSGNDPLYICFSNYDPKGRLTADMAYFGFLPPNLHMAMPRGAVIPVTKTNSPLRGLLVGGKAISCTHDAFPGVRMQPDLQNQGLALAALAGCCITQNCQPWEAKNVSLTISQLGGSIPIDLLPKLISIEEAIEMITGDEPWHWLNMPVTQWQTSVSPVAVLMTATKETVLPLLQSAFRTASSSKRRLSLGRLLLWHGDSEGTAPILEALETLLDEASGLPVRKGPITFGQMLPDHGLMPEAVYLVNALSRSKDPKVDTLLFRILMLLEQTHRDWYDLRQGVYCWCESFAYIASARKDHSLDTLIRRLLMLPEFQQEVEDPLLQERLHMLRITLLRAIGDQKTLEQYKMDTRRILRDAANASSDARSLLTPI